MFKTEAASSAEYLDPMLIATELDRMGAGAKELYGLHTSSLIWKVLQSLNNFGARNHANIENGHGWSEFRTAEEHKDREEKIHEGSDGEMSKSTIKIERNDEHRRKHTRHPKPRYAQNAR